MEKCRKSQNIYIRMLFDEFLQTFHRIRMCLWLSHIKCKLMFYILPVIYHRIIHMYRIPQDICQKTYGIIMKRCCLNDYITLFFIVFPLPCRDNFSRTAINDFPPSGLQNSVLTYPGIIPSSNAPSRHSHPQYKMVSSNTSAEFHLDLP